jgi:hypothetical protein
MVRKPAAIVTALTDKIQNEQYDHDRKDSNIHLPHKSFLSGGIPCRPCGMVITDGIDFDVLIVELLINESWVVVVRHAALTCGPTSAET